MLQIELAPVDAVGILFLQKHLQNIAPLGLVRQAKIDLDRKTSQHRFVHCGIGIIEIRRHYPNHASTFATFDAIQQTEQRVGGIVFPFLIAAPARHEQTLSLIQKNDAITFFTGFFVNSI